MNSTLIRAVIVVTFALICYSIAVINEQRKTSLTRFILGSLTAGVILDISSTTLMILGSSNIPLTLHGFIGYSALIVMFIDAVLVWRFWLKHKTGHLPRGLNLYTRYAYTWWVIAYFAGAVIAMVIET